ncbi:MAG: hypothetical protein COB50_04205 [Thiotrichales bacterium]|nr:MAG: hypothetical protein COB50_04205 [Thiotrichales bacterium]
MKKRIKNIYFKPHFYYETTIEFCLHLGFSANDIAELTGCHVKTSKKWMKSDKPPIWLLPFLYAAAGHVISSKGFEGWKLENSTVYTDNSSEGLKSVQIETYYWHLDILKQAHSKLNKTNNRKFKNNSIKVIEIKKHKKSALSGTNNFSIVK